jgi:hypothetical protein
MYDVYYCTCHADSRAVQYLGRRYRTCLGYMQSEHQTGVLLCGGLGGWNEVLSNLNTTPHHVKQLCYTCSSMYTPDVVITRLFGQSK